jgi:poly(3-hydroxybutyrate) depolymerase
VVFLYHGTGNPMSQVLDLVSPLVNDPEFPFIAVAPESIPLSITSSPMGFEYDQLMWNAEQNLDLDLFDDLLACLEAGYEIDRDRIYVMGFSAGGIMTNFLTVARPDVFAAAASYSGTIFGDPAQEICFGSTCTTWPPYSATTNKTAMLTVWGGPTDTYEAIPGLLTVDFNMHALASIDWWTAHGHNVVGCDHGGGHSLPDDLLGPQFVEFFQDHPKGVTPDPYAAALPTDFPSYCTFHPAE